MRAVAADRGSRVVRVFLGPEIGIRCEHRPVHRRIPVEHNRDRRAVPVAGHLCNRQSMRLFAAGFAPARKIGIAGIHADQRFPAAVRRPAAAEFVARISRIGRSVNAANRIQRVHQLIHGIAADRRFDLRAIGRSHQYKQQRAHRHDKHCHKANL